MRISAQLPAMMAAVLAPLVLAAVGFSFVLADAQREVQMQRILERVRALRLVLDTEVDASMRLLRIQADRTELGGAAPPAAGVMREPLERALRHQARWSALLVVEPDGRESLRLDRNPDSPAPRLDERTLRQVLQTRTPAGSGLVSGADGREHVTFIVAPVLQGDRVLRVVAASVRHSDWLAVLSRHPVDAGATLGITDQDGVLITRTLNPERWVGRRASPGFLKHVTAAPDAAFINTGLEGQAFYSAYSRLQTMPWVLGTGIRAEVAEAPLRAQITMLVAAVLLAMLIAGATGVVLRRRILAALNSLGDVSELRGSAAALPIGEADQVRARLRDTLAESDSAREQADAANRGKDDFLAMMAHELRNPLSAMATAVALLEAARATPESNRHAREVLRRQVQQMTRLVDDLLDAARLGRGTMVLQLAPVDLARLVQQVAATFEASGRTKHLQVELALEPALVNGDALRLEQVVGNLLDNAAKFTPEGGHLRVTLQTVEGQAELNLVDDGVGMDDAVLQRLFDPYMQAAPGVGRGRGGLGLGLHVVRRLIELHGGSVTAHSGGSGRGARFTVRLPLGVAESPAAAVQRQSGGLPPLRVVLVEDDADGREAVSELLVMAGHEVLVASDGEAGLVLLQREAPDVALTDLGLPGIDGLTLARRLREQGGPAPGLLFALTAYGDAHTRAQAQDAGFDGFLVKPFDLREFEISVLEARAQRRATLSG